MKNAFGLMILSLVLNTSAQACEHGEAQVSGHVQSINTNGTNCSVFLTADSVLSQSLFCPVNENLLFKNGIRVDVREEDGCNYKVGEVITGVLIDNGTEITIEN